MSGDLAVWMCTRETGKDGRVFDEPFIATNRAYVDSHPFHDWAPLYSQATVDTLRAQLEAAEVFHREVVAAKNIEIKEAHEAHARCRERTKSAEARAEAAEAECARLRADASRTIAALWDGHMRAEGILGPHNENQVIEEALCVISDCANQSFRWPESIRENIESAYEEIDAARTKEQQA